MSSTGGQLNGGPVNRADPPVRPTSEHRPTVPGRPLCVSQPDDAISTEAHCDRPADAATESPDGRHSQVVVNLLRAANALRSALNAHFAEFGLSETRYFVLQAIRDAAPDGCSQAELAEKLGKYESSISGLVDRMRSDRLIYRLRSKTDRRKRILLLTDQGRQMLAEIEQCHSSRMQALAGCYDPGQLRTLNSLLQLLIDDLSGKQPVIPIPPIEAPETPRLRVS